MGVSTCESETVDLARPEFGHACLEHGEGHSRSRNRGELQVTGARVEALPPLEHFPELTIDGILRIPEL